MSTFDDPTSPFAPQPGPTADRAVGRDALLGQLIAGRYKPVEILGEGGFGVVYRAEQIEPVRRTVALKVIKPGMDSDAVLARFEAERQALALMNHPGVARVLDGGLIDPTSPTPASGRPYFVMEYVKGVPLTEHCDRHRLTLRARIEVFQKVCAAVQHAHSKGVIHRDLKPGNILVAFEDDEHQPKVIDFGVAKAINQRLAEQTVFTQQGMLIGTPAYMSPEQAEMTSQDIDTRSDVYALGVILYELLTGMLPLDNQTLREAGHFEIQRLIREVDPPRPSTRLATGVAAETVSRIATARRSEVRTLAGALRRDLDWVVMKCLEKDRTRRYSTPDALAEELGRFLSNQAVLAGPPSVAYRSSKFIRRHRVAVLTGATVAATLFIATAVSVRFGIEAQRAQKRETAARQQAQSERAIAEAVSAFLIDDLLEAVDPDLDGPDVRVAELLDRAAASAGTKFADTPQVGARMLATLGNAYLALGMNNEAEPLLRNAAQLHGSLGNTRDEIDAQTGLIETLWRRDRFDNAVALAERVLDDASELADTDPLRLKVLNQLAAAYKYSGRVAEAEPIYDTVLAGRRESLGEDAFETLQSIYNTAIITALKGINARSAGNEDEGNALLEESITELRAAHTACEKSLGRDHSLTLICLNELAMQLNRLNRVDDAEPIYRDLIDRMTTRLGDDHWRRNQALANFARLLQRNGRAAESLPMYEEVVPYYRRWLGPDSPRTITQVERLASVYEQLNRDEEAVELLETAYADTRSEPELAARVAASLAALHERGDRAAEAGAWRRLAD
ncbi:MAG: serine/threonine-protein kinase [Planctomycetota bacterium]